MLLPPFGVVALGPAPDAAGLALRRKDAPGRSCCKWCGAGLMNPVSRPPAETAAAACDRRSVAGRQVVGPEPRIQRRNWSSHGCRPVEGPRRYQHGRNMSEFAGPLRRQSPILVDGPPVLNRISVRRRQEQLDKNIGLSNYSQWLTFPAAAKPGGSGGWLSLSIAAIISALVSAGPLN